MLDVRWRRVGREVAIAAFGVPFETFDPWVLDRMTELLEERHVRAGEVLWTAGEEVESLYFMHEGRVRAVREGAPPWTFEGRWFLGGFEGHLDRPARRSLVALSDFYTLKIPRRAWLDLLEDSFELTRLGIVSLASTVARLDQRIPTIAKTRPQSATYSPRFGPLTMVERIAFLTELGIARGAGIQALADVANVSTESTLRLGEELFREAETRDHFFLVVDGEIEAARRNPDVHRLYSAGEVVTSAAALSPLSREWAARARSPARLLAVPLEAWFDLMEEHFDLAQSTMAVLAVERERILDRLAADAGPEGILLT